MKINVVEKTKYILKGIFEENVKDDFIVKKENEITEDHSTKLAYIFLGKESDYTVTKFKATANAIIGKKRREFQIDVTTFTNKLVTEKIVSKYFIIESEMVNGKIFNLKSKVDAGTEHSLINVPDCECIKKASIFAEAMTFTRNWQIAPMNMKRSDDYAKELQKEFSQYKNLTVKVLGRKEIEELKMGLLLAVNAGSAYEPKVVVVEYNGDPSSKEKTVYVGKGLTFDSGGYNLKPGPSMIGMKFDMSGSAIVAGAMKSIAQLAPKRNVSAVMPITDNMISATSMTSDSVWTSMNGKTVEINNTDAEGRLILADGITYAVRNLKATRIVDIATLTGAVIIALGMTYSGAWATSEQAWNDIYNASQKADENIWRLPFHDDYLKFMKGSKVADLKNADLTGKAGSNTAAMFLKEFTEGVEFIHLDVAGTADIEGAPKGVLMRTLAELALQGK